MTRLSQQLQSGFAMWCSFSASRVGSTRSRQLEHLSAGYKGASLVITSRRCERSASSRNVRMSGIYSRLFLIKSLCCKMLQQAPATAGTACCSTP